MIDDPPGFGSTLATWERHLQMLESLPGDTLDKKEAIEGAKQVIENKRRSGL